MTKKKHNDIANRVLEITTRLKKEFPQAKTALEFSNPLQLLIATILSAQCTDVRVNIVTPSLFANYPSVKDFAEANRSELELKIRSTGFYRMKAKHIIEASKAIVERHGGEVPNTMEDLIQLPGVGRKTANCVLGGAYGIQSGVVVDTHVLRIANRLGLTKEITPEKIETDLMEAVPKRNWYQFSNLIVLHGRKTCKARNPLCVRCVLEDICPSAHVLSLSPVSRNKITSGRK
jgi:endonuclease III